MDLEVPITVIHGNFSKTYFVDTLVNGSGLFEFKATDVIHPRHRGQALNYLLMLNLAHGTVVNIRPATVAQRFVNSPKRLTDLKNPTIVDHHWKAQITGATAFRDLLMPLIKDLGAGLDIGLYEDALTHFLGGETKVLHPVPIMGTNGFLTTQPMRLITPDTAFKITALEGPLQEFATNATKLLRHTHLKAVHWANITQKSVTLTTLT